MVDFMIISTRKLKGGGVEIYPRFIIKKSTDLMIRGGDFYAIWNEEIGLWSTDEDDATQLIDSLLQAFYEENKSKYGETTVRVMYLWDAESGMIDSFHKYCQKQLRDNFVMLNENLVFANSEVNKKDYSSKRLSYPLEDGPIESYDKIISTLYTEEERHKIEWAIGAIVCGASKNIQKFLVLYGSAGTGKSTILNIIQQLFDGYYSVFDAKSLGQSTNAFALEAFKSSPLVAIQHDGDLSRIEDNTRLNSLVSHEQMTINEKYRSQYTNSFKCFLFMGTNQVVKITDAKSGLIRRLIDVSPSGNKLKPREYDKAVKNVKFELGGIATHCKEVYLSNPGKYDNYVPVSMLGASNDFYNYVFDNYYTFKQNETVTLKTAWELYKSYCEETKVPYPYSQRVFKEELKNYFYDFKERYRTDNGERARNCYIGFIEDKFENLDDEPVDEIIKLIDFNSTTSILDRVRSNCPAQYANEDGTPNRKWENVTTTLGDLDTSKLHYVKVPESHIVIDFDITGDDGKKSLQKNLEAASLFPATYAELSKSGCGIHLHYNYIGDVSKLSRLYDEHVEIKVFSGKSSLRRMFTKCNDLPIADLSSGLPLKEARKELKDIKEIKNEKGIRTLILNNLEKKYHASTKSSMCFIEKILDDAYKSGVTYDVSDLRHRIVCFAGDSTNQSEYCLSLVKTLKYKSEDNVNKEMSNDGPIVFYDVEVFPNLFIVNWKKHNIDGVVRMINPKPEDIEALLKYKLVGFNCRRYDNHIMYARLIGYSNEQLYQVSKRIVNGLPNAFFGEAYNLSYADIYDFTTKKQSLKKYEIELGLKHEELDLPWDEPVPEELWEKVAAYCDNDVIATEATFNARQADFSARCMLSEVAGLTPNHTTNALTTKIIFGKEKNPQDAFNYRDMGDMSDMKYSLFEDDYALFDSKNRPIFKGYKYEFGKSTYRGVDVGEGGYVYAEPGMYTNVALLDIASMHPTSTVQEELFGPVYTPRYKELLDARIAIKHKEYDKLKTYLNGAFVPYVADESIAKQLSTVLKIPINSVYGLTSAKFTNPFRDSRNVDNIVAKRGALFMVNLKHAVQARGYTVAHIKTDSIKIPDATPEIIQFVMEYGQAYGYTFEHEATYAKMCLVNDAVYIAKYPDDFHNGEWTATGAQFAVPYVFKTLFSKEDLVFNDYCEVKNVSKGTIYVDMGKEEQSLQFVGKVGKFTPHTQGGKLYRVTEDGKQYAVTGTKDHLWMESDMVETLGLQDGIDKSYHNTLVNKAVETISKYGDFEWFAS